MYLLEKYPQLFIALIVCIVVSVFTIVMVRKSSFDSNTKVLLYILAAWMPPVGLIFYFILNSKTDKRNA